MSHPILQNGRMGDPYQAKPFDPLKGIMEVPAFVTLG